MKIERLLSFFALTGLLLTLAGCNVGHEILFADIDKVIVRDYRNQDIKTLAEPRDITGPQEITITDPQQIEMIKKFLISEKSGWEKTWITPPVPILAVAFYSRQQEVGWLGYGAAFFEASYQHTIFLKAATQGDIEKFKAAIGYHEK